MDPASLPPQIPRSSTPSITPLSPQNLSSSPSPPPVTDRFPSFTPAPSPPPSSPHPPPPSLSTLEKLIKTCPVWLQLGMSEEKAALTLQREGPGMFLVRKNLALKKMILSLRLPNQEGAPQIQEIPIKDEKSMICLEGSVLVFDNIFKLISFYSMSRDILPFTLRLPQVIAQATKYEDMDIISSLGINFWGSSLNTQTEGDHRRDSAQRDELCAGSTRLWYINPILMEDYCNGLHETTLLPKSRTQSLSTPGQSLPGAPHPSRACRSRQAGSPRSPPHSCAAGPKEEGNVWRMRDQQHGSGKIAKGELCTPEPGFSCLETPSPPPPRALCKKQQGDLPAMHAGGSEKGVLPVTIVTCGKDMAEEEKPAVAGSPAAQVSRRVPPVPPPRHKRASRAAQPLPPLEVRPSGGTGTNTCPVPAASPAPSRWSATFNNLKGSNASLNSPERPATPLLDSCSNSSTEEEAELSSTAMTTMKRSSTIMLDRAKQRLSMVSLPQVFTRFMKADCKLQRRIVELARDRDSYFGNLVRDYQTFTLETMRKHSSSTEMLQEIRQMLTQLKSYLIQSTELRTLQEAATYPEEKLEAVIELALYKGVLKPIREAVYSGLQNIHTRDDSLKKLKENQQVVLNTTTTDLGITTSVPETPVMEKIQQKLDALHREYSPEEKITHLLKTCKMIYESMSVGSPGRPYGADDFLPVLMYVLVRCNITALLLDVEYMMELMDPALQLGEGSYYLTTTYGALEHIKNYDRQPQTQEINLEIQDSIHRWERRRTHNKNRLSRSSVQDFINVAFPDASADPKTLCVCPKTTTQDLCAQCASKFEVADPESYGLWVLVEGEGRLLAPDELPLSIKSGLHYAEPRRDYRFVYQLGSSAGQNDPQLETA